MTESLLSKVSPALPDMGRAERHAAEYVRRMPARAIKMNMASPAQACGVSDPTIVRLFRHFGFEAYDGFRTRLVQDLVPTAPLSCEPIRPGDAAAEGVRKTCHNSISAIRRALQDFSIPDVGAAAWIPNTARWIGIVGTGMSEITALDAGHRFGRPGLRYEAIIHTSRQSALAHDIQDDDAIPAFSQSEVTRRPVEPARGARPGAAVVAVAAPNSPPARVSTLRVGITPHEHMKIMTPLASRLKGRPLTSMLTSTLLIANGEEFPDQLPAPDPWITEKP
ncbi:MAG: MurR/RpiR family transcriptional regulator [Rhodobacteraceae bacterium]|nr:MurR/RpiR family transcriptional regulator [Paracoccaceae bacterium]